jgi:D-serine deaminase-like pyridoxal phosphate-dependent protein
VCSVEDIALSVLATVIGHQADRGWIITDAGWTAMSRDRGTASQRVDQGYGLVCDLAGRSLDLVVAQTSQEHGIIAARDGSALDLSKFPVGTMLRVLPNHACATAAGHPAYHVVRGGSETTASWPRFQGW